jgi:hypothetical protein
MARRTELPECTEHKQPKARKFGFRSNGTSNCAVGRLLSLLSNSPIEIVRHGSCAGGERLEAHCWDFRSGNLKRGHCIRSDCQSSSRNPANPEPHRISGFQSSRLACRAYRERNSLTELQRASYLWSDNANCPPSSGSAMRAVLLRQPGPELKQEANSSSDQSQMPRMHRARLEIPLHSMHRRQTFRWMSLRGRSCKVFAALLIPKNIKLVAGEKSDAHYPG